MTRHRRPRPGFTLVELAVSFGLAALLGVLVWQTYTSGRRQGAQVEQHSDLIVASLILREHLFNDLEVAVGLQALPETDVPRGQLGNRLVLPRYIAYHVSGRDDAISYEPVVYQWDPAQARMTRDGKAILRGSRLTSVQFRWTEESPVMLEVTLKGQAVLQGPVPELTMRLPAPKGTEVFPAWVLAPHHRRASPASP